MEGTEKLLDDLINLLGLDGEETAADSGLEKRLLWILNSARARLKLLLGGTEPPEELEHIIVEAAVIRFNRMGSEGLDAHTVEGESQTFGENDFAGFMDEINAYLDEKNKNSRKGGFKFL